MEKILILANNSVGLHNFRFELIEELIKKGYEVYFSLPESSDDEKSKLIIQSGATHIQTYINRRGINPFEDLQLIKEYKRIVLEVDPDIVLTYTIKPNIYGTYVASKSNKPVIMNITGIGTSLTNSKLKYIVINLYKYACKKARLVFFQNQNNHSLFIDNKIVDTKRTMIIPGSGVNLKRFIPSNRINEDDKIKFLFIGRLMKEKGIEEYLQVAERLIQTYSNLEFQILGPFEEKKYNDILYDNKNKNITYLGTSKDVRNEIRSVDCIINPSHHEGMSNVLLEGAAMGKALIASNIPGCKEIIEEGYNGYLFDVKSVSSLEEKVVKFIKMDDKQRTLMGQNSRKKVEKEFDRNIVVNKYVEAINGILGKGRDKNESI